MKISGLPPPATRLKNFKPLTKKGFTLVELMVSLTLCLLLSAAVLPTLISGLVLGMKTVVSNRNSNNIRLSTEHVASHINCAVLPPRLDPVSATSSHRVGYTTSVGLPGQAAATSKNSDTIQVTVNGTCHPAPGDRIQIAGLDLGDGLVVTSVTDSRTPGTSSYTKDATVTLQLAASIQAGTVGTATDISDNQTVSVFRDSAYQVITGANGKPQLAWFEQAASSTPTNIVAYNLDAGSTKPFSMANNRVTINFMSSDDTGIGGFASGKRRAYTHAGLQAEVGAKSGSRFDVIAKAATPLPASTSEPPKVVPPKVVRPPAPAVPKIPPKTVPKPAKTVTKPTTTDISADF